MRLVGDLIEKDNDVERAAWRVRYEDVYRKGYNNMAKLRVGLAQYFAFYNGW